jgi:hypothetical protein
LGGARFLRKLQTGLKSQSRLQWASKSIRKTLTFEDVVAAVEKVRGERWEDFRDCHGNRGRDQALYLARRATPLSLSALAQAAGLNQHAGVAVAVKRYGRDAQQNPTERKLLKQAAELLRININN